MATFRYEGIPGGGGADNQGNVAFVSKSGNDGTAVIGDLGKPYLTFGAAYTAMKATSPTAAARGKIVGLDGGTYNESLLLNGAYIDFDFGEAIISQSASPNTIETTAVGDYIYIRSRGQIVCTYTDAGNALDLAGKVFLDLNIVHNTDGYGVWMAGEIRGSIKEIITDTADATVYAGLIVSTTAVTNDISLKIHKITCNNSCAFMRFSGSGSDTRLNLDIDQIIFTDTTTNSFVTAASGGKMEGEIRIGYLEGTRLSGGIQYFYGKLIIGHVVDDANGSTTTCNFISGNNGVDAYLEIGILEILNPDSVAPYSKAVSLSCSSGGSLKAKIGHITEGGINVTCSGAYIDLEIGKLQSTYEGIQFSGASGGVIRCKVGEAITTRETILNGITTDLDYAEFDGYFESSTLECVFLIASGSSTKYKFKGVYRTVTSGREPMQLADDGGTVELEDCRCEATAGNTDAVLLDDANELILNGAVLIAIGTGVSIGDDGSARTVKCYDGVGNAGIDANIVVEVNEFVTDANVV